MKRDETWEREMDGPKDIIWAIPEAKIIPALL